MIAGVTIIIGALVAAWTVSPWALVLLVVGLVVLAAKS